jgi:hypothetical protein
MFMFVDVAGLPIVKLIIWFVTINAKSQSSY